jgi:predicted histidine transporter YuiF (NhaC family)
MQSEDNTEARQQSVRKNRIWRFILAAILILIGILISTSDFLWPLHFQTKYILITLGILLLVGFSVFSILRERKRSWTSDQLERLEKARAKGPLHFIILYGVIGWGVPFGIIFILVRVVLPWISESPEYRQGDLISKIAIAAALCLIGGLVLGILTWSASERRYRKYIQQLKETETSRE